MQTQHQSSFQQALDVIESFPDEQQHDLITIVQKRLTEKRRDEIAENIKAAKEEYRHGDVRAGSVEDLMKEIES